MLPFSAFSYCSLHRENLKAAHLVNETANQGIDARLDSKSAHPGREGWPCRLAVDGHPGEGCDFDGFQRYPAFFFMRQPQEMRLASSNEKSFPSPDISKRPA